MARAKKKKKIEVSPLVIIIASFICVILTGSLLLSLPFSTRSGAVTPFTECLFTATSATCVTGLVVHDTYNYWSVFGQAVLLVLIQIGGLGLVTITLFIGSFVKRRFGLKELTLAQESVNFNSLPEVWNILRMVVVFSASVELAGAAALMPSFIKVYGSSGIFKAVFISISAYCNAGFDLMGAGGDYVSLIGFYDDPAVLITVMVLIVTGGLGVLVWYDVFAGIRRRHIMLHSRLVFLLTGALIFGGALLFFLSEYYNPATIGNMDTGRKILNSFFQSVTTRTAGFATVSCAELFTRTKLLFMALMFIGAAPGSTAGGIKITTFWVLVMTVVSFLRGRHDTVIHGKRISNSAVYKSVAAVALILCLIFASVVIIYSNENVHQEVAISDVMFEVFSAVGTVGLSADLTPTLTGGSLYVLMADMFLGRVGIVTLALAIVTRRETRHKNEILPEDTIIVG